MKKIKSSYLLLLFSIVVLDRTTKFFLETKAKNYGAAFGILKGHSLLFILAAFIVIIVISCYFCKYNGKKLRLGLILILSGTIGNLIDRIYYGYVIDIIKLPFFNFPAFNIADISNIIGAILLATFITGKKQ